MRNSLILILLLIGCTHAPPSQTQEEQVSLNAALNQAQMSYLKGCVDAFKSLKMGPSFDDCRHKAKAHRLELNGLMDYNE